jgi:hypothetical protein
MSKLSSVTGIPVTELWAQLKSYWYLLTIWRLGVWRGERVITTRDSHGKLSLVAVGTGSIKEETLKLRRIFLSQQGN